MPTEQKGTAMSQKPDTFNPFDPIGMFKTVRDGNMDAWSKAMIQLVNSEVYAKSTAVMLDAWLTTSAPFRKVIESTMTQVLVNLNMPTRADVTTLAERLTNIEMRLDDLEAELRESRRAASTPPADPSARPGNEEAKP
jgi:polyhydroxyalkanoate synthesis regulator phasin